MRLSTTALAGLVLLSLAGCVGDDDPAPTPTAGAESSPAGTGATGTTDGDGPAAAEIAAKTARASLIFGPGNVFRLDISKAPVAPRSAAQIKHLMGQITPNYSGHVALNAHHFNSSMFVATPQTPTTRVKYVNCQHKTGPTPSELYGGRKYFVDVPIPPGAKASVGTDKALTIWAPHSDQLWELWQAEKDRTGAWTACWGGRIDHVSHHPRGTFEHPYGVSASGLATVGSMITVEEAKSLRIDHAVQLFIPASKAGEMVYPANRNDGRSKDRDAIALGTRLRLPASVDVEKLRLPPLAKAIARAAQKYGFLVNETSGAVAVGAESPHALQAQGRPDPWPAIYRGVAEYDILADFPWSKLEVVEHGYGAPVGTTKVVSGW